MPFLLPPPSREAEEGEQGAGGAWAGGPGARRQAGVGGKGGGRREDPVPHLDLGRSTARRQRHGGRWVAGGSAVMAALWSVAAARKWGKWREG